MPLGHLHVFFGEMSIYIFHPFIDWVICFLDFELNKLYILEINPLSVVLFANIVSYSEGCLFLLFMVSFSGQRLLSLITSHLFIFVFIFITLGDESKKILLRFMSKNVLLMFSSKSFIVSGLTFRSLINFEFIFVYGVVHFLLKISHYFHNYISFVQFLIDLFQQNCLFLHF